ncbi:MAG: hypothetical protein MJ249_05070 [Kiritimatiellae bacterium]|nr:hypothetical protein [Kiritimatiellia bacterium]
MDIISDSPDECETLFGGNLAEPQEPAQPTPQEPELQPKPKPQEPPRTITKVDPKAAMTVLKQIVAQDERNSVHYDFNEVKRAVGVSVYLNERGIPMKGNRFNATWRGGERFSCSISEDDRSWYDHVEKAGASVLDLAMRVEGFPTVRRAAYELGQRFNVTPKKLTGAKKDYGKEVAHYDYVDANGVPLYAVIRYDPKKFVQRRLDQQGRRVKGSLENIQRVPYHLPELIAEVRKPSEQQVPIFLTEGEKDADNLRALGLVATSAAMGAGNWKEQTYHYSQWFKGARRVLIVADRDPATDEKGNRHYKGQYHATEVQAALANIGVDAAVAYVGEGKDASDWIAALHSVGADDATIRQKFIDLAENTPQWEWTEPPEAIEPTPAQAERQPTPPRFGTITATGDTDFPSVVGGVNVCREFYTFKVDASKPMYDSIVDATAEVARKYTESQIKSRGDNALKPLGKADVESVRQLAVVMWLRSCGQFYRNAETRSIADLLYFNRRSGRLLRMASDEFNAWLSNNARVNRADKSFGQLVAFVEDAAMDPDISQDVVPQAFVARTDEAVYISCGESKMVRLKGGRIETVANGTDGVLFPCEWTLKDWNLLSSDAKVSDPFDSAEQFEGLSFNTWYGRYLLRAWYLNLFAHHRNRTPLLLAGERGSGKTSVARALREMAGYPIREAGIDPKKEEDFWVAANGRGLLLFDNVEEEAQSAKWLTTAIEKVTTGGAKEVRKLYTQTTTSYRALSDLVFASKTPSYCKNEGVAHRFVIVNLNAGIGEFKGDELLKEIADRRDEFMTWTARTVAAAMEANIDIPDAVNERYPDFGRFALRCAHVLGDYDNTLKALQCGELEKSVIVLKRDGLASEIFDFLSERDGNWEGRMTDIARTVHAGEQDEILNRIGLRYAKTINRLRRPFEACFKSVSTRISAGITFYRFGGLNDLLKTP